MKGKVGKGKRRWTPKGVAGSTFQRLAAWLLNITNGAGCPCSFFRDPLQFKWAKYLLWVLNLVRDSTHALMHAECYVQTCMDRLAHSPSCNSK